MNGSRKQTGRATAAGIAALVALAAPGAVASADASQLIDRNATAVRLEVSGSGVVARVTYRARGTLRRVLASGALNAVPPSPRGRQVQFRLDYSGRSGRFRNACTRYDGPPLAWLVTACKARDGSYWALQRWQRGLPNYGLPARSAQAAYELRLSHWRGPLATLTLKADWAYDGRYDNLYGSFTYLGVPVYGFRATPRGSPLDPFGRNLYIDTLDSAYGRGWRRENSFLTHNPRGNFCYALVPRAGRPSGKGSAYRATVIGPGVTPDVMQQVQSPGAYSRRADADANREQVGLAGPDDSCRPS